MKIFIKRVVAIVVVVSGLSIAGAMANDPMGNIPILDREFSGLTAKGFNLGLFTIKSRLSTGIEYTSNTLQSDDNEVSERVYRTVGALNAVKETDHYDLTLIAEIDDRRHQTTKDFNHTNARGFIGFVYDLSHSSELSITGSAEQAHQTTFETGTVNAAYRPTEIREYEANARWRYKPGTIRWDVFGGIADRSFEDTEFIASGNPFIQTDRDATIYTAGADIALDRLPSEFGQKGITPFLGFRVDRTEFDRRDFDANTNDFTGVDQSNWQYGVTAGVEFAPTGKLRGTARVGYGLYRPDDGDLDDQSSSIASIDLTYLYSPLTNFMFGADRFFTNNTDDVGGTLETRLSARVIHELTRRWIFDAGLSYTNRSFSNTVEDDTWITDAGIAHRLNDRFSVEGDVQFISRESSRLNADYDETKAMIRLNTHF
jgi:hypothetical protein